MSLLQDRTRLILIALLLGLWLLMLKVGGPGSPADLDILYFVGRSALVPAAHILTELGAWWVALPAACLAGAWLAWRGEVRKGAILFLIVALGRTVVELQKYEFDRERPDPHGHLVAVHNMAFPSGHSSNAMMAWLAIALLAAPARFRVPAIMIALLLAALTGFSRLVLAVHWPSDVVGGWAFGAAWVLLFASFAERAPHSAIAAGKADAVPETDRPDDRDPAERN
jgi:undecaprenyl-diphosphatase